MTSSLPYRIGLPAWAFPAWKNKYFTQTPSSLASYASVFNMVEGNTTFYQVPSAKMVASWKDALARHDCKICLKLPKEITHNARSDWSVLDTFLQRIKPLQSSLGPLMLVFPSSVGPENLSFIRAILKRLPENYPTAIEVRHQGFFNDDNALAPLLHEFGSHRVVLDSRPLYRGDQKHPDVVAAQHEKPKVPVSPKVYNQRAFVRLVLHPNSPDNQAYIEQWAKMFADYLKHDIDAYISIHCPNNLYCPEFALTFHKALQAQVKSQAIPDLPPFPVPQQSALL